MLHFTKRQRAQVKPSISSTLYDTATHPEEHPLQDLALILRPRFEAQFIVDIIKLNEVQDDRGALKDREFRPIRFTMYDGWDFSIRVDLHTQVSKRVSVIAG